jgi:two-component sensor histidine kinase
LQREGMTEGPLACQLAELGNRIRSMALVHEMLYQSNNLNRIDFHEYLQTLITHLRHAFDPSGAIRFEVAATGVFLDLDTAIPCGLIVNELVINALKYAFPESEHRLEASTCEIVVTAAWDGAAYTLTVADNGVGLPAGLSWATTRTLGLRLVRMLGRHQLGGQLELHGVQGTRFSLRFGSKARPEGRPA